MTDARRKNEPWRKEFARRLKGRMRYLDMNKEELAVSAGLAYSHVLKLTRGDIDPRASTILKLAQALNVDASYLLCFENVK